jgi:hypothetical protein
MTAVSIRYQNGTTVEANNLGDALVHLMHTGTDYVVDVVEQAGLATALCEACNGTGIAAEQPDPDVVLTREQIDEKVGAVNEQAPRDPAAAANFDERVKVARRVAKA